LVDVCQVEQGVSVDEALVISGVAVREEEVHDIILDQIEGDDWSEGGLRSEGVELDWIP
jgi:hypothetical protein